MILLHLRSRHRGLQGLKAGEEDRSHCVTGLWESAPPFAQRWLCSQDLNRDVDRIWELPEVPSSSEHDGGQLGGTVMSLLLIQ